MFSDPYVIRVTKEYFSVLVDLKLYRHSHQVDVVYMLKVVAYLVALH